MSSLFLIFELKVYIDFRSIDQGEFTTDLF